MHDTCGLVPATVAIYPTGFALVQVSLYNVSCPIIQGTLVPDFQFNYSAVLTRLLVCVTPVSADICRNIVLLGQLEVFTISVIRYSEAVLEPFLYSILMYAVTSRLKK